MTTQISNKRRRPSDNETIVLLAEVDRLCPLCSKPLQYWKGGRLHNRFELAHLYPLNPTTEEKKLLKDEEHHPTDVNAIENFLALCEGCHAEFDKPRTLEEFRKLVLIKKKLLSRSASRENWWKFSIQEELRGIVAALMRATDADRADTHALSYDPKTLDEKVGNKLDHLSKNRVRFEITSYYQCIRQAFRLLESSNTASAQQILLQVKAYYLEQTKLNLSHADILHAVAAWVATRTDATQEASHILASFFVQNCEVF
ncbi:MAG: ABC-three component system protein [Pirellulales bacterium]